MTVGIRDPGEIVVVTAADGCRLKGRLWRASPGAPLLLAAHGVMSHSLWFHRLAAALRERDIALLAFDRRGAGLNRDAGDPLDEAMLVRDLDAWLDLADGISCALNLLGFCWGSNYALHYLGQRSGPDGGSERVRSLVLMAPGVVPAETVALQRSTDQLAPDDRLAIPLDLEDFTAGPDLDGFLRPDPLRLTHTTAHFVDIQNRIGRWSPARLVKLRLPLLTILAADDSISDNARIERLVERSTAPKKSLITLPGRHGIVFDAPDPAAEACRRWIFGT